MGRIAGPMPRFLTLAASSLLALSLLACGSERKFRYEDYDMADARAAFQCAPGLAGDRKEACRMLDEFAAADAFAAWPAKGVETWLGRKVCSDRIDEANALDMAQVHLSPGIGQGSGGTGVKTDASRDVPYGAEFIATSASASSPDAMKGYRLVIDAAAAGTEPKLDTIPEVDRTPVQLFWNTAKKPTGISSWRLVKTDGKSVSGNTHTTDIPKGPSASYFMRGKANKMLIVYASNDPKVPTCVGEAWRIATAP